MGTSLLQVRVETSLKDEASSVFENLGIDISTAVRMFLKRSVMENGIPFRMTLPKQLYSSSRGLRAMQELGDNAKGNGTSDMTLEEINAEIAAYRQEKQAECQ
ncbi:MAG: type II toxin-antitoxin system RelB/DinJ family antitoxin [Synergistaceae bacterium]|nr:type II toxin-antitoxin system RelB/DinJ family antitoxin [Synergistaceae bacterium]